MTRTPNLALLVWPLCGALIACGADQKSDAASSDSGTGGVAVGGAGSGAQSSGGSAARSAGGQGPTTGGAAGTTASGGTTAGLAGQGAGGDAAGASGSQTAGDGGTVGEAGAGGAGPVEGIPGATSFTKLTIRVETSPPVGASGPCDLSVWSFDRASKTLTWDLCQKSETVPEHATRTLDDAEAQGILNSLLFVQPGKEGSCFADAAAVELELEVDGNATVYHDEHGWCGSGPNDENYVGGLYPLQAWVAFLSAPELPTTPATLALSTGVAPQDPPAGTQCTSHFNPREYQLVTATRTLSWYSCALDTQTGVYKSSTDSRVLDTAELASVLDAYGKLVLGVSGPCDTLTAPASLDSSYGRVAWLRIDEDTSLLDETASCFAAGQRGGYAMGVAAFTELVDDLGR